MSPRERKRICSEFYQYVLSDKGNRPIHFTRVKHIASETELKLLVLEGYMKVDLECYHFTFKGVCEVND